MVVTPISCGVEKMALPAARVRPQSLSGLLNDCWLIFFYVCLFVFGPSSQGCNEMAHSTRPNCPRYAGMERLS